ncbi:MAG TPA: NAD-dependent succinate-semialdehyde dehydrogenase [Flavitalea sp.]|nr:NAD-dependent succinate-semialdehyde dehydrogenase [Flavitalea sp.]
METLQKLIRDQSYINGKWTGAVSGKTFDVVNPATGKAIASVADLEIEEIRTAIDAASEAFPLWAGLLAKERAGILMNWFRLILDHKQSLATLVTMECGKPYQESLSEVIYGASFIEWFAEEGKRAYGDVIPQHAADKRLVTIKQPVGVAAVITPWNFPLAMVTRKLGPALAAGCAAVVKPPSPTPLTSLALAKLAGEAGIPQGVLNVVTTSDSAGAGKEFSENEKIRKLSFTGSTEVGRVLLEQCAPTIKKVSMELGGNAPFIVFDDADIDAAVKGVLASKYRNSGQTCVCTNRILVQENAYDAFVKKLTAAVAQLKSGNGLEEGVMIGPLINEKSLIKVKELVDDAIQKGASATIGGKPGKGLFFQPTVLTNATPAMRVAKEEIFGPVAPVFRFHTEKEAIDMANDTEYGLAAYFYSRDVARCWRVAEALEYGMVGINEGLISTELAPFGGIKQSGLGREGSKYGIDEYLEIKYMCFGNVH